jgi:hypothetical protein
MPYDSIAKILHKNYDKFVWHIKEQSLYREMNTNVINPAPNYLSSIYVILMHLKVLLLLEF